MRYKFLVFLILSTLISCGGEAESEGNGNGETVDETVSEVSYTLSSQVISNPERGFMHTWSVASEGAALNETTLNNLASQNVTVILRLYYLNSFKNSDLSVAQLDLIKNDFASLRDAGIKCVLRFAYNSDSNDTDAPLNIVESHLDQLAPIFQDNQDVIAFVQAGFIGSWGEWYFSSNGLDTPANRASVLDKLLEVLPKGIKVQLRTPGYKQEYFNTTTAIGTDVGYGTSDIARVGFHNDCFLASVDDYGTYQNVATEKAYIRDEAFFVPTGGETCPPSGIPSATCTTAEDEMSLLKWTYLNLDYYGPVLNLWKENSCFTDFERRLGYRLVLKSGTYKKEATTNGNFTLSTVINNTGFAPVYNSKNTFLIFRSVDDGTIYKKALNFDVRRVVPSVDYQLDETVSLSGIPAGNYELLLKIEDVNDTISDRPEYSIQLANTNTWESTDGLNDLQHTLTIK